MIHAALFMLSVVFIEGFLLLKIADAGRAIVELSAGAAEVIGSKSLSDAEKEVRVRRASMDMLKATGGFLIRLLGLVLLVGAGYIVLQRLLGIPHGDFAVALSSIQVIVVLTLVSLVYLGGRRVIVRRLLAD